MAASIIGKKQALDLLISYHGTDAFKAMREPAPAEALPEALRSGAPSQTFKDVVLFHLENGTRPNDLVIDHPNTIRSCRHSLG